VNLAGHRDMSITKRYVHPQECNKRAAIENARVAFVWAQFWVQSDGEHNSANR